MISSTNDLQAEPALEAQVMATFVKMKVEGESVRDWFRLVIASQT